MNKYNFALFNRNEYATKNGELIERLRAAKNLLGKTAKGSNVYMLEETANEFVALLEEAAEALERT